MRILYLDYDDSANPYAAGGQAYATREITRRLATQSHQVTVVTGNYPGARRQSSSGVSYVRLGIADFGYLASILSFWLLLPWYVFRHQGDFSVILECLTGPFTVSFVPLVAKKPLIAAVHFFDSGKLAQKYRLPLDIFQKTLLKKYPRFIVMTKQLAKRVKSAHPGAVCTVIPGGVSQPLLASVPILGDYVLYIGRIDIFNKGLDLLIKAWQDLPQKLVIAGSGRKSEVAVLKKLISKSGLSQRISWVGQITGQKKIDLYRRSLLVVQPTLFETFGFVALEALAAGKLLVCFDIPGYKWIPKKFAVKIKNITVSGLKQGLQRAISSETLLKSAQINSRKFAYGFNWNLIAQKYERYLKTV